MRVYVLNSSNRKKGANYNKHFLEKYKIKFFELI